MEACAARLPGVDVRAGRAEDLPVADAAADVTLAQLVLPFVDDAPAAVAEMRRATRPGGTVAACIWDVEEGMQMLRAYWDAALALDPSAPDEARTVPLSRDGEVERIFRGAGLVELTGCTLEVRSAYSGFDELWAGFQEGIGPAGVHCASLTAQDRERLRAELYRVLGRPRGGFTLGALARCTVGRSPLP